MMKATDLFMSIPALLLVIVLEAIWGEASYTSLSLVIGDNELDADVESHQERGDTA